MPSPVIADSMSGQHCAFLPELQHAEPANKRAYCRWTSMQCSTLLEPCRHHRSSGFSWHVQRNPINSDHLPGLLQILLGEHLTARVADIGLGKTLAGVDVKASSATFLWAAPEQLQVRSWFASTSFDPPWPMILADCHCNNDKAPVLAPWQS